MNEVVDILTIVLVALTSALLSELANWYLVQGKPDYARRQGELKRVEAQLAQLEDARKRGEGNVERADKRLKGLEEAKQRLETEQQQAGMIGMMVTSVVMIGMLYVLRSTYTGYAVARLPFEPSGFLTNLTHQGLLDNDFSRCGFLFIYVLSSMAIKPNLTKLFGSTSPQSALANALKMK